MSVKYVRLDFCSRDHEEVSREVYYLLHDIHSLDHVDFEVTEGHRSEGRQAQLVREKGVWSPSNPTGAARPSRTAPHIMTGSPAHAFDCEYPRVLWVVAAAKKRGVRITRPIPTEPWHCVPNAVDLHKYAVKHLARRAKAAAKKAAAHARPKNRRLSDKGLRLIAGFEGERLVAYKPVASERYWTIGYGHYGRDVRKGQRITHTRALELLRGDVKQAEKAVNALDLRLTQGQFDALVSIAFNCGAGVLARGRSLGDALRKKGMKGVPAAMRLYVKDASGHTLEGLMRRRRAEAGRWAS